MSFIVCFQYAEWFNCMLSLPKFVHPPFSSLVHLHSSPFSYLDSSLHPILYYLTISYHIFPTLLLDGMTTDDKGQGSMTSLGRFSGAMPLDLRLGMLIHYGIALGTSHTHHHSQAYAGCKRQHHVLYQRNSRRRQDS